MAREAAALGIPAYTVFAGRLGGVDTDLIRQGRLVQLASAEDFDRISLGKAKRNDIGEHRDESVSGWSGSSTSSCRWRASSR